MEPALKQRLMGAAVLVALAVIFLPMLFSGPAPPPPAGSLPLDMPAAPERAMQTREIPLALPARPTTDGAVAIASPPSSDPDRLATVNVPVLPSREALDESPVRSADDKSPPAAVSPSTTINPISPLSRPPVPPTTPPATPTSGAESTAPAGSRFVVNLGSYSNTANANSLVARLKKAGVQVYSETIQVDGKSASRLRAGPFATRAAAESAMQAVRRVQSDLPMSIVGLDADETAPARAAPAVAGGFVVQVGAFSAEADANALRERLRQAGFAAFVERVPRSSASLWRVRIGPETRRAASEEARLSVKKRFDLDGQVLTYP